MSEWQSDLVALVADASMESAVRGLLSRRESLRIRPVRYEVYVHPHRDPGCLREAHSFLHSMTRQYAHALVLFDRHGCGREHEDRQSLEGTVAGRLAAAGWAGQQPDLRTWLRDEGMWTDDEAKPADPKEATLRALRRVKQPLSSSLYEQLAGSVSLERCTDPAFAKLRDTLRKWFPQRRA